MTSPTENAILTGAWLTRLSTKDLVEFRPELERLLGHVDFFKTPFGQWLEAAALTSVLSAASNATEYRLVQQLAKLPVAQVKKDFGAATWR